MKIRNILFILVLTCCFFSAGVYQLAGLVLPGFDVATTSEVEGRALNTIEALQSERDEGEESSEDETFSMVAESVIADALPGRDQLLLLNALLQRQGISTASLPFGYGTYPSYYGSDYYYWADAGVIFERPVSYEEESEQFEQSSDAVAKLVKSNGGIDWRFFLVDRSDTSFANPVVSLAGSSSSYAAFVKRLKADLPEDCKILRNPVFSKGDYAQRYLRTDHHWRISEAVYAYSVIASSLRKDAAYLGKVFNATDQRFYGSNARGALIKEGKGDSIEDVNCSMEGVTAYLDDQKIELAELDRLYAEDEGKSYVKEDEWDPVYARWFHNTKSGVLKLVNANVDESAGTLLILGDSYAANMERFFTKNYRTVFVIYPKNFTGSLKEFLSTHQIDDAVFLMCEKTLSSFRTRKGLKS